MMLNLEGEGVHDCLLFILTLILRRLDSCVMKQLIYSNENETNVCEPILEVISVYLNLTRDLPSPKYISHKLFPSEKVS